jgi:hypothetical protein
VPRPILQHSGHLSLPPRARAQSRDRRWCGSRHMLLQVARQRRSPFVADV